MNTLARTLHRGFTLLELSIVIVIIGLIIGAFVVEQDMVRAAQVRSTITQYEKFNSAAATFQGKYDALPGDLLYSKASSLGFFAQTTGGGSLGHGDDNGLIEGEIGEPDVAQGEVLIFWRHLTDTTLIDGTYGVLGSSALDVASGKVTATHTIPGNSVPPAKIGGMYFVVHSAGGINYFSIEPISQITKAASSRYSTTTLKGMSPIEGYNIDSKIDDGEPNLGMVRALGIAGNVSFTQVPTWTFVGGNGACLMSGTAATDTAAAYNRLVASGGKEPSCALRLQFK